jgi:hypothetical protein
MFEKGICNIFRNCKLIWQRMMSDDIETEEVAVSRAEDWLARNDSISCELSTVSCAARYSLWKQKFQTLMVSGHKIICNK